MNKDQYKNINEEADSYEDGLPKLQKLIPYHLGELEDKIGKKSFL